MFVREGPSVQVSGKLETALSLIDDMVGLVQQSQQNPQHLTFRHQRVSACSTLQTQTASAVFGVATHLQ